MSAYRVALCEDKDLERGQVAALCRDMFAAQGVEAEIVPFASADALRQAAEGGRAAFDLYLLDIEMREGASGLDLARQLYQWGIRGRIIFITGNPEYAIHGYDVEPLPAQAGEPGAAGGAAGPAEHRLSGAVPGR